MGLWSLGDYGIAFVTVVGLVPSLIIGGVAFILFYAWLAIMGLVSAVLWAIGGAVLLWVFSLFGVFKIENISRNPKTLLLLLIVPIFFVIGYLSEHSTLLSALALNQIVGSQITLGQLNAQLEPVVIFFTPEFLGALFAGIGIILVIAIILTRKRRHR